jgi:hypothetical protein
MGKASISIPASPSPRLPQAPVVRLPLENRCESKVSFGTFLANNAVYTKNYPHIKHNSANTGVTLGNPGKGWQVT